ncbi:hypothetical protein KAX29_03850 [candidate division WOR-3 bacterium]|nr:hypothetical protein [candidate division WOR-3 bacterium]
MSCCTYFSKVKIQEREESSCVGFQSCQYTLDVIRKVIIEDGCWYCYNNTNRSGYQCLCNSLHYNRRSTCSGNGKVMESSNNPHNSSKEP